MKSLWRKLKNWLLGKIKAEATRVVDHLDDWEPKIAEMLEEYLNPEETASKLVDFVQAQAHALVDKISDKNKWVKLFGVKTQLHALVDSLDEYEGQIAELLDEHLNPEEKAKVVVDYVQALGYKWLEKIFG